MKRILWDDRGYALVLTLLFMPVFIGLSLVIIDIGRGNNAHSDLQAAADAAALAAAGELDGQGDSITRALDAAGDVINTVSFLGLGDDDFSVTLNYDGTNTPFNIIFLTKIPDDDAIPIDQSWAEDWGIWGTDPEDQASAKYVYVAARSRDLDPMFMVPVGFSDREVPIQARAVATRRVGVCEITPMFMCNPFETAAGVGDFKQAFDAGKMNGRLVKLHNVQGQGTPGPGNYGFLDMGSGGADLTAFFAMEGTSTCYSPDEVVTETGGKNVAPGLNTRFDIYEGSYKNTWNDYPPAANVRKGYWDASGTATDTCGDVLYEQNSIYAPQPPYPNQTLKSAVPALSPPPYFGFPDNQGESSADTPYIGEGSWDIDTYFEVNHGIDLDMEPPAEVSEFISDDPDPTTEVNECVNDSGEPICDNPAYTDYVAAVESYALASKTLSELDAYVDNQFKNGVADPGVDMPSRFAVYLWELEKDHELNDIVPSPARDGVASESLGLIGPDGTLYSKGESGVPSCSPASAPPSSDPLRRVVQTAIVNCKAALALNAQAFSGKKQILKVEAYASFFLTAPMEGANNVITGELIDATGVVGNLGTLDTFVRPEAVLVR